MVGFAVKESKMQKNSPKKIFQRIQRFMTELEFHSRIDFAKKADPMCDWLKMRNRSHNSSLLAFVIVSQ